MDTPNPLVAHLTTNRWLHATLLFLIAIGFYYNAVNGGYVLDDGLVLNNNEFVKRGLDGIGDIMTHDSFYGSIGKSAQLNGGRYRPLSLVTFAIEYEMYGLKPQFSRIINIVLYGITGVFLYLFLLRFVFPLVPVAAFVASLIFVIHPVHTEVVANIKSRDEIISFLLLLGTLYYLLSYVKGKKHIGLLFLSLLHFALALLAKENGLAFVFIVPLTLFVFCSISISRITVVTLPFVGLVMAYLLFRISVMGFQSGTVTELMDNPFLLATTEQRYSTIAVVFLNYFKLLFFPHPLTYDYSYNQIPYASFSDPLVWLSITINGALIVFALYNLRHKSIISWSILFYYASLFLVSNILINIGAPMGERFLYQAGFPLGVVLVTLFNNLVVRIGMSSNWRWLLALLLLIATITLSFYKTHNRNKAWLKGETLGLTDVQVSNKSARALTYAGINLLSLADTSAKPLKDSLTRASIVYLEKALAIHPTFGMAWQNLGVAYYNLGHFDQAANAWMQAAKYNVGIGSRLNEYMKLISNKYFQSGLRAGVEKNYPQSISLMQRALHFDSTNAEIWYNLGGAYYSSSKIDSAEVAWKQALHYNPNHTQARNGLQAIRTFKK